MVRFAAVFACTALGGLALLHVYWAFGGHWGMSGTIPMQSGRPIFHPGKIATLVVAFGLFAMSLVVAVRVSWVAAPLLFRATRVGTWLIAAVFGLRAVGDFRYVGFFKTVHGSNFARLDTLLYSPFCVVLFVAVVLVALSKPAPGARATASTPHTSTIMKGL